MKQASGFLSDAVAAMESTDPKVRANFSLRRQVARLSVENWELRQTVAALTKVLLDNNLIDHDELAAAEQAVVLAGAEIVDDTEEPPAPGLEPITLELIELEHAVEVHDKLATTREPRN